MTPGLFPQLLSPSNVAVYGGLCALATFDRQELQRNVISSRWGPRCRPAGREQGGRAQGSSEECGSRSSFKLFLELEPQIRDIIFKFYESKYASCLKMLDEMKVRGGLIRGRCGWRAGAVAPYQLPLPGQPAPGHVPGPSCQDPVHPDSQSCPHPGEWGRGGTGHGKALGWGCGS